MDTSGKIKLKYQTNNNQTIDLTDITNNKDEFKFQCKLENIDNLMCITFDSDVEFSVSNIIIE